MPAASLVSPHTNLCNILNTRILGDPSEQSVQVKAAVQHALYQYITVSCESSYLGDALANQMHPDGGLHPRSFEHFCWRGRQLARITPANLQGQRAVL